MREQLIKVALADQPADLILKDAKILNLFTGEILDGDIAIKDGYIAATGNYTNAHHIEYLDGQYVVPGFINAHCHVESSMIAPETYCMEELRHGVTTLITDPHEAANVAGVDGILFMLDSVRALPINYFVQVPSCVPATPFENAGATLGVDEITTLLKAPGVLGLGEMMNCPGVLNTHPDVMAKINACADRVIDGHMPGISGTSLQAIAVAGIHTDHECTHFHEALEKLRAGFAILVREGSACKDLESIISGVVQHKIPTSKMAFCTDDKHLAHVRREGTIRHCIRKAISLGLPVTQAYAMATYNAAQIYRLHHLGAVSAGYMADLVVIGNLHEVDVKQVYKRGMLLEQYTPEYWQNGTPSTSGLSKDVNWVNIAPLEAQPFILPNEDVYSVIGMKKGQIVTKKLMMSAQEAERQLKTHDLCKIAVIERHRATGNVGIGLLSGYGLQSGAVATTVAHDSHNLIVTGTNDEDMRLAVAEIIAMKGGYVFVQNGRVIGRVSLPIFGLMSAQKPESFIENLESLIAKVHQAGVPLEIDPFVSLSFMALPVIPEIRITDKGMWEMENRE